MNVKLDLKDLRILHELDINARSPFSRIGKRVGLSESVVRYRVERLQNLGVIRNFFAYINTEQIGYSSYHMYIKMKVVSEQKEREIVERLRRIPNVSWLASVSGHYNFAVCVLARSPQHFQQVESEITKVLENCIVDDSVLIVTSECQLPYPVLQGPKKVFAEKLASISPGSGAQDVTAHDLRILECISTDARISLLALSQKLNLRVSFVSERLDRLVKAGVVQAFKPLIDMSKLGKQRYLVLFKLKHVSRQARRHFFELIKAMPQTFYVVDGIGNWDCHCEFYCTDDADFKKLLNRIFPTEDSAVVREYAVLRIVDEHKCVYYPVGVGTEPVQATLEEWLGRSAKRRRNG